ncbi:hypothetical protein V2A60_007385 [Cordyceps javanica]|uniref:Nitrate assimilation regulatory protein nirA n=1 Tax=Cordyceps javanica TaxID=43265 RepID=A0A545W800_9HYPO|nr:nitrate assimilation regulatory protein nirA [Cordyceps javanica]TQW10124.1 nitrate assimilation regulatory protein nirA [Cordyceps javanica]
MAPVGGSLPRLLPKPSTVQDGRPPAPVPRRRQPVSNACNICRTRKTKCDGARPQCRQCARRNWECIYTAPPGVTPQQLRKARTENFASVVELIRRSTGASAEEIARRIRDADNVDAAIGDIADASILLQTAAQVATGHKRPSAQYSTAAPRPLLTSPFDNCDFIFEKRYDLDSHHIQVDKHMFVDVPGHDLPLSNWTSVSADDRHMNHLLNLFFTWDNVVERVIFRPMFEEDVRSAVQGGRSDACDDDANGSFCTRFLVNSLLALGCLYSMDPATYKSPEDPKTRGRLWADEAEHHLEKRPRPSIPLMQGLYALFVYEGNLGNGTKSVQYFMRCMDVYRSVNERRTDPSAKEVHESRRRREKEAESWCLWGLYCYEWRSTEAFGLQKLTRQPKVGKLWRERSFPLHQPNCVGYWWYPYPISLQAKPSMQVAVREADVALSEIVERILQHLHPEESSMNSTIARPDYALELYDALTGWKYGLPDELRFEQAALPSVLMLHIALEVMYIAILRPFAHKSKDYFGRFSPRERCAAHASHVVSAIWAFRAYGQIRCEYYLTHPLGTAAYIMLQEPDGPMQLDSLVRACQCLYEMRTTLPLAVDVLSGIRAAFRRYRRAMPVFMAKYFDMVRHRQDGLMHHAVAGLLPDAVGDDYNTKQADVQLEELLRDFGNVDIH